MASDDPLTQALAELEKPAEFSKLYDASPQRFNGERAPIIKAVRLLIGEVQSLQDEVEDLRQQLANR
ncbi:hypothetical protein [Agromyces sp. NPDC058064]|uniref:hypothetical protein n=1 Tax=Agromyces sp. NPDC058064 TaxID=3346322 RepID=UPI0036DF4D5E